MTNSFIEKKVEEFEKEAYDILGLEVDPHGTDHMLLTKDEDGNVLEGVSFSDEVQELKSFLRSALRDHAEYLRNIVEKEMEKEYPNDRTETGKVVAQALTAARRKTCSDILALLDKEVKK